MITAIRGRRVLTPEGIRPATLHMNDGRIARVADWRDESSAGVVFDAGESLVMPGVIDTHVHVNEPGRTEWEGFASATRAAAAGGVTTILDMPLNCIPATTSVAALETKRRTAQANASVNVEFIGGLVPGNIGEIEPLTTAGVRAFKCFLSPSGVEEFAHVDEADLRTAFPVLARTGLPLMVHAEDPALVAAGPVTGSRSYADYLGSRSAACEHSALAMLIRLMEWCATRVHIVHLSSASCIPLVRAARAHGLPLTVEACPHYLTFAAGDIPDGATQYKCAPPIRDAAEREGLWHALVAGDIDVVASDHSPCPPALKETHGDFFAAWGGIASLQVSLSAVWTGARQRGIPVERVAEWMCGATARLAGIHARKGRLASGYDADIVVWDPDADFVLDPAKLLHRHHITPYAGRRLFGVVDATFVAGRQIFSRVSSPPESRS